MSGKEISVIVPSYNEEGNIGPFCGEFDQFQRKTEYHIELIFVDDG